jgi:hypothetical protein
MFTISGEFKNIATKQVGILDHFCNLENLSPIS